MPLRKELKTMIQMKIISCTLTFSRAFHSFEIWNECRKKQQQQLIYHYINNSHANQVVIRQEETIHIHVWFVCRQSSNLVFWTYTQIVGVVIEFLMMTMTMAMMLLLCFLHFINWDDSLGHKKNIYNCIIGDSTSHTHTTKTSTTRWEREKVKTEMENL